MVIPRPEELLNSTKGQHPLKEFLRLKGISLGKFSVIVGHSESSVSKALNGIYCSANLREKIDQVCKEWGVQS